MSSISVGISQSLLASSNLDKCEPRCVHIPPHLSAFLFSGRRFSDKIQPSLWSSTLGTFLLVLPKLTVGPIEVKPAAAPQLGNWENRWQGRMGQPVPGVDCPGTDLQNLKEGFFYTLILWTVCDCLPSLQLHELLELHQLLPFALKRWNLWHVPLPIRHHFTWLGVKASASATCIHFHPLSSILSTFIPFHSHSSISNTIMSWSKYLTFAICLHKENGNNTLCVCGLKTLRSCVERAWIIHQQNDKVLISRAWCWSLIRLGVDQLWRWSAAKPGTIREFGSSAFGLPHHLPRLLFTIDQNLNECCQQTPQQGNGRKMWFTE